MAAGATVIEPLAGLKLGQRWAWYGRDAVPRETAPEPSVPGLRDARRE